MDRNLFKNLLNGYVLPSQNPGDARISYGKTFYASRISGTGVMRPLQTTRIGKILYRLGRAIYFIPCRAFGALFLSFGLVTLLSHFAYYYFFENTRDVFIPLVIGILSTILSVFLLVSEKPLANALQDGRLSEYLLFEFFCFRRVYRNRQTTRISPFFMAFLGCTLAALAYFITPQLLVTILLGILFLVLSLSSPEFPFYLTLLLLPFLPLLSHPTAVLCALVLQDTMLGRIRICGATTDLAVCVIMLIGVMEGAESGGVFALCAGVFYHFSGSAPRYLFD